MTNSTASPVIVIAPSRIRSFARMEKPAKTEGHITGVRTAIVSVENVWRTRYIIRIAVIYPVGIPSLRMNHAATGCPPVAEGVIAEQ